MRRRGELCRGVQPGSAASSGSSTGEREAPGEAITRRLRLVGVALLVLLPVALELRLYTAAGVAAFWALLVLVAAVASVLALRSRDSVFPALLVANAFVLIKTFILPQGFQLWGTDAFAETSVANAILSAGHWLPTQGLGAAANYYGYFPAVHLLIASQSLVTSLSTLAVSKYVIILVFTNLIVVLGYLVMKALAKDSLAFQGLAPSKLGLLYALSLGIVGIFVSRRLMGFTAVLILILLVSDTRLRHKQLFLVPLAAVLLAFSDHLSVYVGLPIFALFVVARWRSGRSGLWPLPATGLIVLLWYGFVAWPTLILRDLTTLSNVMTRFNVSPSTLARQVQAGQTVFERLVPYLGQAIVGVLGLVGLYLIIRRARSHDLDRATAALLAALFLVYVAVGLLVTTSFAFLVNSVELVGALGITVLFLLAYNHFAGSDWPRPGRRSGRRTLIFVFLIVILISGNLMVLVSARYIDSVGNSRAAIGDIQVGTPGVWTGGAWLANYGGGGGTVYADQVVQALYSAENLSVISHTYGLLGSSDSLGRLLLQNTSFVYLTASTSMPSTTYPGLFPLAPSHVASIVNNLSINIVFANPDVQVWYRG